MLNRKKLGLIVGLLAVVVLALAACLGVRPSGGVLLVGAGSLGGLFLVP